MVLLHEKMVQMMALQQDLRNKANYLFDLRNKLSSLSGKIDIKIKPVSQSYSSSSNSSSSPSSNKKSPSGFSTMQRRGFGLGGKRRTRNKRGKKTKRKRSNTKRKNTKRY